MKPIQGLQLAMLAAVALVAGCSGGGGGGGNQTSSLSVSLMDAPVDGVTAVYIKITAMWIKPKSGSAVQLAMPNGPMTVNIMGLTETNAAILVDNATIAPGDYEWIAMDIAAEPNVRDSYVITAGGAEQELETDLRVPSNRLRLVSGFTVPENQAVKLIFDWDMRQGLVYPPGQGRYFLKPAFRMIDVTAYGVLEGTIKSVVVGTSLDPAVNGCAKDDKTDLDVGNVVYVFAGAGVAADDIDGTGDPVATVPAKRNAAGDYVYRTLIAPGKYSVAFTCQAGNDDPDTDETGTPNEIKFLPEVDIDNTGGTSTVDFNVAA